MTIPLVDLKAQYSLIKTEIDDAVHRVLSHTGFILGAEVSEFEGAFAQYVGAKECVGVASGTAALHLALRACGIGPGHEVITSSHTFIATAEAISMTGATPVFVDIDERTYTLNPERVEQELRERMGRQKSRSNAGVRAIIPVHLYGHPAYMDRIMELAENYGLWVIEDAAQAHGAEYHGKRCGSIGHLACFSFFPGKNLGAYGDAGAVTGNDPELMDRVRKLRNHGRSTKYLHEELGFGERLDALQAAILSVKTRYIEKWTEARRVIAGWYNNKLDDADIIRPFEADGVRHVYHLYVVRTQNRDAVLARLQENGIMAGVHYPVPVHRQPAYLKLGYAGVSLPVTESVVSEIISLPVYPELTEEEVSLVCQVLKKG